MSKVYSFRLSDKNPREAQAIQVIETWASKGFSLRQLYIEAVIAYANVVDDRDELIVILKNIEKTLEELKGRSIHKVMEADHSVELSNEFIEFLVKSARPGIRIGS
jgi:hypothetical protein